MESPADDEAAAQAKANDRWPAPEVAANVDEGELGDLGLTPEDVAAIVAFLRTLSDEESVVPA